MTTEITLKNQTGKKFEVGDLEIPKEGRKVDVSELARVDLATAIGRGFLSLDAADAKAVGGAGRPAAATLLARVTPVVVGKNERLAGLKKQKDESKKATDLLLKALNADFKGDTGKEVASASDVATSAASVAEFAKTLLTPPDSAAVKECEEQLAKAKQKIEERAAAGEDIDGALADWASIKATKDDLDVQDAKVKKTFEDGDEATIKTLENAAGSLKAFKA